MMDGGGFTAMHTAALQGSVACIKAMADAGLDVNIKSHGQTALARAIDFKRPPQIIAALRAAGGQDLGWIKNRAVHHGCWIALGVDSNSTVF